MRKVREEMKILNLKCQNNLNNNRNNKGGNLHNLNNNSNISNSNNNKNQRRNKKKKRIWTQQISLKMKEMNFIRINNLIKLWKNMKKLLN